jgi:hypothetical protein
MTTSKQGVMDRMRHVRILGISLIAAFAVSAVTAASALAITNPDKSPLIFKHCPIYGEVNGQKTTFCFVAATNQEEGEYKVGGFTVPLTKQVLLQFGTVLNEETGAETFVPAEGAPTLPPTAEKVPGTPISRISPKEREEFGWPQELTESYLAAKRRHLTNNVFETIELAGKPVISRSNLLFQEGTAVEAPVKVKAANAWLTQLGTTCYIGSDEGTEPGPIVQHLVSGVSKSPSTGQELHGEVGELAFYHEFQEAIISNNKLVDNTYPVPGASCSGPFAAPIAATIDKIFGIPAVAGASFTSLKGALYNATAEWVSRTQ